jgi:hypothetical protein
MLVGKCRKMLWGSVSDWLPTIHQYMYAYRPTVMRKLTMLAMFDGRPVSAAEFAMYCDNGGALTLAQIMAAGSACSKAGSSPSMTPAESLLGMASGEVGFGAGGGSAAYSDSRGVTARVAPSASELDAGKGLPGPSSSSNGLYGLQLSQIHDLVLERRHIRRLQVRFSGLNTVSFGFDGHATE